MPISIQSQSHISTAKTIQSQATPLKLSASVLAAFFLFTIGYHPSTKGPATVRPNIYLQPAITLDRVSEQDSTVRYWPSTYQNTTIDSFLQPTGLSASNFDLREISVVPSDSSSSLSDILRVPNLSSPNFNLQLRQRGAPTDSLAIPSSKGAQLPITLSKTFGKSQSYSDNRILFTGSDNLTLTLNQTLCASLRM